MILSELVQLTFDKILQTRTYTVIVMSSRDKKFAIYTEPSVGKILQMYLTGVESTRPQTHDLIEKVFTGLDVKIKQVVINDLDDTTYYARLFLEQTIGDIRHIIEIDVRPSDSIILAIINNAPVFGTREMLDKTIAVEE
jgi:bifunctional DNase/RNase